MISLDQLKKLLGNLSIDINSQFVRQNLGKDGKGKIKVNVNGSRKEEDCRMHNRKRMLHNTRSTI